MKKGRLAVSTLVVFLSLFSFIKAGVADQEDVSNLLLRLKPAVALVYVPVSGKVIIEGQQFDPDPRAGIGTGFLINPDGYLITNGHVVADYRDANEERLRAEFLTEIIFKYFIPQEEQQAGRKFSEQEAASRLVELYTNLLPRSQIEVKKDLVVILSNGERYDGEIKAYSPPINPAPGKYAMSAPGALEKILEQKLETGKDIAVVKIEGRNLPTVKLGDSDSISLGESVYIIGFPGVVLGHPYLNQKSQLDATVTGGGISGAKLDIKGTKVIQTDASVTHGNSGGPGFDPDGEVIGIATFISIEGQTNQAIQGFNFLVPINTAKEFVADAGVNTDKPSLFNKLWFESIGLYTQGNFQAALSKLDEALRIVPNQPDARNLQVRAQEELDRKGSETAKEEPAGGGVVTGMGKWPVVAAIALVVIAIAGLLMFQGRRKTQTAPPPPSSPPTKVREEETGGAVPPGSLIGGTGSPYPGHSYAIKTTGTKIGRDPTKNHIVVDNEGVSREHAWIGVEGGRVVVKDLNSLNGTYINSTEGSRVKSEPLKDGDTIIIGKGNSASFTYRKSG